MPTSALVRYLSRRMALMSPARSAPARAAGTLDARTNRMIGAMDFMLQRGRATPGKSGYGSGCPQPRKLVSYYPTMIVVAETDRLILRPFCLDDGPAMDRVLGDPQVMLYGDGVQTPESVRRWLRDWIENHYPNLGFGMWAVVE